MKKFILSLFVLASAIGICQQSTPQFNATSAERFANLTLACVHKEYPNKISHNLNSDADVAPPRKLTPAFYGCYDWHSSVHGHWLLARLVRTFPDAKFIPDARVALRQSLTAENIVQEVIYLKSEGRASFERPYGLAWLLQLAAELRELNDADAHKMYLNLLPLEKAVIDRLQTWLVKLPYPIRVGEHAQTAFSLGLMLDYARISGNKEFAALLISKAKLFYAADKNCPMDYEPSGEDFLSPCLAEADAMRRVLGREEFALWLKSFMPQIPITPLNDKTNGKLWLEPVVSPDPSDPKLAHLDGLNISRAWMLEGIASALPMNDDRVESLHQAATAHQTSGLAAVTGEHYEGGHWLGSFAVYLVTKRGICTHD